MYYFTHYPEELKTHNRLYVQNSQNSVYLGKVENQRQNKNKNSEVRPF